jgi:hypothetical protein
MSDAHFVHFAILYQTEELVISTFSIMFVKILLLNYPKMHRSKYSIHGLIRTISTSFSRDSVVSTDFFGFPFAIF